MERNTSKWPSGRCVAQLVLRQILGFLTTTLVIVGVAGLAYAATPARTKLAATNQLLPGIETNALATLEPRFRQKVERILKRLRARGFSPRVAATYRSAQRQNFVFHVGAILELYGGPTLTRVPGGRSCHNQVDAEGAPAALAADILAGARRTSGADRAVFYRALGQEARREGLTWGGAWSRSNAYWAKHGLGWDPGHVQERRCTG